MIREGHIGQWHDEGAYPPEKEADLFYEVLPRSRVSNQCWKSRVDPADDPHLGAPHTPHTHQLPEPCDRIAALWRPVGDQ